MQAGQAHSVRTGPRRHTAALLPLSRSPIAAVDSSGATPRPALRHALNGHEHSITLAFSAGIAAASHQTLLPDETHTQAGEMRAPHACSC